MKEREKGRGKRLGECMGWLHAHNMDDSVRRAIAL
jgi:hypothetical protein